MDRNMLRAVIAGLLLVPLAWIVIALAVKQHGQSAGGSALLIWGILFLVDLVIALYSVLHLRRTSAQRPGE